MEEITLARELGHGDHVDVPRFGEVLPTPTAYGVSPDGKMCREMNGYFATVAELQAVSGIGPVKFEKIREKIAVGERPSIAVVPWSEWEQKTR
jgi:hypothetical protein